MARKQRIEFDGALYHVITRGNQKQKTFKGREDYRAYLDILARYKERYHFLLYGYVLMTNHVHLLIETRTVPLSKILQGINQSYTLYFNRKHNTVGHLFQGRYKAILCDKDRYLLALIKYIHLNPLRAKAAHSLDDYEWSSHRFYARRAGRTELVDVGAVLRMFAEDAAAAGRRYQAYMGEEGAIEQEDIYRTVDQRLLGDERFVESVREKTVADIKGTRRVREYSLMEIARGVERVCSISLEGLRSKSKSRGIAAGKHLFCLVAHEYGYQGKEIAGFMRKDPAVVSRNLRAKEQMSAEVDKVAALLRRA